MKTQIPILMLSGFFLACNPQQKESTELVQVQQNTSIQESDYFFDAQQQALGTEIPQTTTQHKTQEHTGDSLHIIQKPITYNAERKKLSIQYMRERHGLAVDSSVIQPKMIVIHYTGGGTANSIFNYFDKVEIESSRIRNQKQSKLNESLQYLVVVDNYSLSIVVIVIHFLNLLYIRLL